MMPPGSNSTAVYIHANGQMMAGLYVYDAASRLSQLPNYRNYQL